MATEEGGDVSLLVSFDAAQSPQIREGREGWRRAKLFPGVRKGGNKKERVDVRGEVSSRLLLPPPSVLADGAA